MRGVLKYYCSVSVMNVDLRLDVAYTWALHVNLASRVVTEISLPK